MSKPPEIDTQELEALLHDLHRALYVLIPDSDERRSDEALLQPTRTAIADLTILNRRNPQGSTAKISGQ
jgi:hypothetical protein